ncbi:peptide ABC transporter permease [Sulfolobales archaeon HS-7]|nr:peptide ABC transporter permease [Sulfolobales archaeon HS-7]
MPSRDSLSNIFRNKIFFAGFLVFLVYVLMGTVGLLFVPYPSPKLANPADAFLPPSLKDFPLYIFGTDYEGLPLFDEIVWGTPFILEVTTIASLITIGVGVSLGLLAGFLGKRVDMALNALFEMVLTIPGFPITLILATIIHTSNPLILGGILSMFSWAGMAKAIRGFTYSLKNQGYVMMAQMLGFGNRKILFGEIVYPMMSYILVHLFQDMMFYVFGLVGLYAFGFLPLNNTNWGVILNFATSIGGAIYSPLGMYNLVIPIIVIIVYEIGLMMMSIGVQKFVDPRLRNF